MFKTSSGEIGTSTQSYNLQPTGCPAYGMFQGKVGTEIAGVANNWSILRPMPQGQDPHSQHCMEHEEPEFGQPIILGYNQT